MWWERKTSSCTQIDVVGVGDKWSGLKQHGGGRKQVIVLELKQLGGR